MTDDLHLTNKLSPVITVMVTMQARSNTVERMMSALEQDQETAMIITEQEPLIMSL